VDWTRLDPRSAIAWNLGLDEKVENKAGMSGGARLVRCITDNSTCRSRRRTTEMK
jgi:hypothetical protein